MNYTLVISTYGIVWGVAEGATPVEACEAFDKEIGGVLHVYREIDEGSARDGVDHYLVYEGDIPADDGRCGDDEELIDEVSARPLVARVAWSDESRDDD